MASAPSVAVCISLLAHMGRRVMRAAKSATALGVLHRLCSLSDIALFAPAATGAAAWPNRTLLTRLLLSMATPR
eukprot:2469672-Pleurochrysis_carterae.AAC.2